MNWHNVRETLWKKDNREVKVHCHNYSGEGQREPEQELCAAVALNDGAAGLSGCMGGAQSKVQLCYGAV